MAPPYPVMTESEYNARYGAGSSVPATPAEPAVQPVSFGSIPVMTESEFRRQYGSVGENAVAGITELPASFINMPKGLAQTVKGTASSLDNLVTGEALAPEEAQGVRNMSSLGAAASGAMLGGKAGALGGAYLAPYTYGLSIPAGAILGGAAGGAAGLLGLDWFAEKMGVDAPRTGKERVNDLAYNTAQGLAGDLTLRGVGAGLKSAAQPFRRIGTVAGQTEAAANVAQNILGENAVGRIADGMKQVENVPLAKYRTTAEVMNSEAAAQLQKQLEMEKFGGPIGDQNIAREAARKTIIDNIAPNGPSIEQVQKAVSDNIDQLKWGAAAEEGKLPPAIDPTAAGAGLRDLAEQLVGKKRADVKEAFGSIPEMNKPRFAPNSELLTATDRLKELFGPGSEGAPSALERMVETLSPASKAPAKVDATTAMLQELRGEAPPAATKLPLDYLQRLRRWAGEEATKRFNFGDNRAGSVAQAVVKDIDTGLAQAAENGTMPKAQADAYRNALSAHAEMAQTFERGPIGRILRRGQGVEGYNVEPSAVGRQFWNSSPEAMQSFSKAMGGDLSARELLTRDAITDFKTATKGLEGLGKAKAVNNWMNDHQPFLTAFPELKKRLGSIYELEGKAALKQKNLGKFIEANPEQAINQLMSGRDSIKNAKLIKREIGANPDLVQSVRSGIINKLNDTIYGASEKKVKPLALKDFLKTNDGFLKQFFNPTEMGMLRSILEDTISEVGVEDLASRASKGQAITAQKTALGQKLSAQILDEFGVAGRILAKGETTAGAVGATIGGGIGILKGGNIGGAIGAGIGGALGSKLTRIVTRAQEAALAELARAAADPKVMQQLLTKATDQNTSALMKMLEPRLNPIRQMMVSSIVALKQNSKKGAESLAGALSDFVPSDSQQPTAPRQAEDLARALSENASPALLESGEEPTISEESAPVGDVDLDAMKIPNKIDASLVNSVAWQESRNRPNAIGPQTKYGRAKGRLQLLDSTGEEYFKKLKLSGKYDPFDAEQNTKIGTAYLKDLTARYNGSVPLALAAYNWGMGNLEKSFDKLAANLPPTVKAQLEQAVSAGIESGLREAQAKRAALSKVVDQHGPSILDGVLPKETRNYVSKILDHYNNGTNKSVRV